MLQERVRIPLRRTSPARPRLALASIVPLADVLFLSVLLWGMGWFTPLGGAYAGLAYAALRASGTQASRINPRMGDDIPTLLGAVLAPVALVAPFAVGGGTVGRFVLLAPFAAVAVLLARSATYFLIRAVRAKGFIHEPTLIVGAGEIGREVARTLQAHPEYGLVPMGFLDCVDDEDLPLPLLGRTEELEGVAREFAIRRVIVAFGVTREPELVDIIRTTDRLPLEVHLVPRFFELGLAAEGPDKDDVWGIPLIRLRRAALRTVAWRTKRAFDLLLGSILFLATLPVLALSALAVRLSSPGPIFFRQERIGQDGRIFMLLKFRTLAVNAESDLQWSVEQDGKVTWIGRILRRTSLDELPQFLNVLRGQMSLIGPRPERPYFVDRFSRQVGRYGDRHRVPVGITGWAQVHGLRGDTSIPERVRFDNFYIEHWSAWRDLVIVVRTIWLLLTGRH